MFLWRKEKDVNPRRASTVFKTAACSRSADLTGLFACSGPSAQDTLYGRRACTSRGLLTAEVNSACAPLAARPPPEHKKSPCGNLSQGPCVSVAEGEGFEPPEV